MFSFSYYLKELVILEKKALVLWLETNHILEKAFCSWGFCAVSGLASLPGLWLGCCEKPGVRLLLPSRASKPYCRSEIWGGLCSAAEYTVSEAAP